VLRVMMISSGRDAQELRQQLPRVLAPVAELRAVVRRGILVHVLGHAVHRLEHRSDEGQRLAAFSMVSSRGMTNCSRTLIQNFSSGDAGVGGSFAARAQVSSGVTNGAAPPMAKKPGEFATIHAILLARRQPGPDVSSPSCNSITADRRTDSTPRYTCGTHDLI